VFQNSVEHPNLLSYQSRAVNNLSVVLHKPLGKRSVYAIHDVVAALFDRARVRLLGRDRVPRQVVFGPTSAVEHRADLSLPGIFDSSSRSEGFRPRDDVRESALRAAASYLDAYEARTKAAAVEAVEAHLRDAVHGSAETAVKALNGRLADVLATATRDVERMVETEVPATRNLGALDGLVKVNTLAGVDDPVVYFVSVKDGHRCEECTELHTIDGVVPRVWFLSEIETGFHKRGSEKPSLRGLHPHCRCSVASILPGWGFKEDGGLQYISDGYLELKHQRG
jgi:hypothetical protein